MSEIKEVALMIMRLLWEELLVQSDNHTILKAYMLLEWQLPHLFLQPWRLSELFGQLAIDYTLNSRDYTLNCIRPGTNGFSRT